MSKTKKIRRLTLKVERLQDDLDLANSEFCKRINRRVKFQRTPVPEVFSLEYEEQKSLSVLMDYLYNAMDDAYNMAYAMGEKGVTLEFILYIDHNSLYKLEGISNFNDLRDGVNGDLTFFGHKVVRVHSQEEHINFVRIK